MKFTRAIALCALTLAIALAIGAIAPMQPYASAGNSPNSPPERVRPTPALATAEPTEIPPVAVQLPVPTPQVIYVQLPPPQVVYVQQPAAAPEVVYVEQQPAAAPEVVYVEQQSAAPVEQPTAGEEYQLRRLDAINRGAAYRPSTR